MNTTLMAVIRDLGGMEWLKAIGKEPWFRYQYDVAYWMWLASTFALVVFMLRLAFKKEDGNNPIVTNDLPKTK
jgi:hypothetical protein